MKFPGLPTSAWLLAIGATATLLIGAFAHFDPNSAPKAGPAITAAPAAVADQEGPAESAGEPDLPADLSPGLAEIIRMAQAHVDEGVILSYVQNSGQVYAPSADEILYLSDLGLSQNVIAALFKNKLPEAPPAAQGVMAAMPALPALAPPASAATARTPPFFTTAWPRMDRGCKCPTTAFPGSRRSRQSTPTGAPTSTRDNGSIQTAVGTGNRIIPGVGPCFIMAGG